MGCLNFRFLINFGLLALPVGVTLGILLAMQGHRGATGQPPLFVDNGVKETKYCQQFYGITPETKGQEYTLNPNQWGWEEGDPGQLCVDVISFNNKTYPTNTTAPEFSCTWDYPQAQGDLPVHAFPNIKVDGGVFPAMLKTIRAINVDMEWTYGIGNDTATTTDLDELKKYSVNTNVAFDMFLDPDKTKAMDPTKAGFEVMVWFAQIGPATQPLGADKPVVTTKELEGVTFELYFDQNENDQYVLTWLAKEVTHTFKGDLSPLIEELLSSTKENFPTSADYLGYLSLGTEALYTDDTFVTFHVPLLSIDVQI